MFERRRFYSAFLNDLSNLSSVVLRRIRQICYTEGMVQVSGIGGVFFRARDPALLKAWYEKHLGVWFDENGTGMWVQDAGPTVVSPFSEDTDYFPRDKAFMLNFRVDDLDAAIADFTRAGIEVETRPDWDVPGIGRFARILDPEGNPIELWQPETA